ncbi:MAG TPA: phytanoyl-CoA dioxygenase family protein [Burkholderiales bacterium]|nr:phytanoyl-CoA dioxygenase family protein [Burkholderiales bacterium]
MITPKQVDFYRENGYIVVENLVDAATRDAIKAVVADLIDQARGLTTHNDVYDLEPSHTPTNPRVRRIKKPTQVHPIFDQLVKSPQMVAVLKALIGPNVRLHGSKLNMKDPQYGSPVEWHQDWAFYPHTNDDILAIGVMLEDIDDTNGPLLVLPGTHRGPVYDHHVDGRFCGAMDPLACGLDFSKAVACPGKAGSCSFHHVRLVHGSAENTSNRPRPLMLYEVAAADAWPLVNWTNLDEFNSRMICGEPTIEPRLEKVPVRMPYPPALKQGSIYENQTVIRNRYFGAPEGLKAAG